jgi:hypothetical protein
MDRVPVKATYLAELLSVCPLPIFRAYIEQEARSQQVLWTCHCLGITADERTEVTDQLGIAGLERYLEWRKGGASHAQAILASEVPVEPIDIRHLIGRGR